VELNKGVFSVGNEKYVEDDKSQITQLSISDSGSSTGKQERPKEK